MTNPIGKLKISVGNDDILVAKPLPCPADMNLERIKCPECKALLTMMNIEIIQYGFVWDRHVNTLKCEACHQGYYVVYEIAFAEIGDN